jgi:flavin-dependent dehydrogenase
LVFPGASGIAAQRMGPAYYQKTEGQCTEWKCLQQDYPGWFWISRFKLDNELKDIAVAAGVKLHEDCRVEEIKFENGQFHLKASGGNFRSRVCCGSFGKRSNIDLKLKRDFVNRQRRKLDNLIAVKYHIKTDLLPIRSRCTISRMVIAAYPK